MDHVFKVIINIDRYSQSDLNWQLSCGRRRAYLLTYDCYYKIRDSFNKILL